MDFQALQAARESCRVYSSKPVSRETLTHLVDVARLSPSGCNAQPWRFIIVDEPEAREKLIDAFDDDGLTGCPWGENVPAFILICEDEARLMPRVGERYGTQHFAQMDIGMAAMALCYEATALGLGTCIIGTMSQEKLHHSFGIPPERPVRLIITVGYPAAAGKPRTKARKSLEDILRYNHW
ncbi:nitroreductase family protein [Agathobaculum sp.]|uniref:nitroreductase family protein n=1 Tax=Agathobaculum sp. TaxID=2048138 RepID=UPI002A7F5F70|nr:nitroreductase family protein [Agathobaculum sp.]MDY3617456.1 nitroreductase family protein [Agathobaculum sp.]